MLTDSAFEAALPILEDETLEEDEKTDKIEELFSKETGLTGKALEDAVLEALWRYRDSKQTQIPTSARNISRRGSPAPWQLTRTLTPMTSPSLANASPVSSHYGALPPGLTRVKSSTASPFTSPRPSPRLAFTSPIPHSPNLNSYEFHEPPTHTDYGDLGSEGVDWLVGEAASSRPTSSAGGSSFDSGLNAAAPSWVQPTQSEMSPYDILRSVMGESRTDAEIETALEANQYDLSATITSMMNNSNLPEYPASDPPDGQILIGKSMDVDNSATANQKTSVVCKYWLATGSCLRADCRFSHEFGSTLCRYWMMGTCLAGETCVFSHDPAQLLADMNLSSSVHSNASSQPTLQVQDYNNTFPVLQGGVPNQWSQQDMMGSSGPGTFQRSLSNTSFTSFQSGLVSSASARSFSSRPTSRHSSRAPTPSIPQVDDTEAFPSLGSIATIKLGKKHHGKRGGHGHAAVAKEGSGSLLADIIRQNSATTSPLRKGLVKSRSYVGKVETSPSFNTIPPPEHIPWLETGERANQEYLKARQDALKHGGLRNKFLQSAAQAWNRNDARAAKALSLRGQSENDLMRKAHRQAADVLYAERSSATDRELYVDLHGLHPEDAVSYLEQILLDQQASKRPIYAITGTSHHSKNGKDKMAKAIRQWLIEWKFTFREFSVPSDRGGNTGSILGIDASTFDRALLVKKSSSAAKESTESQDAGTIETTAASVVENGPP